MSTATKTSPAEILKDNLEHSIFSWSKQSGLNPMNIERAKGVYLYDRSGKKILDFSSQLMNVNIGHGHPKVAEAVAKQMAEVSYVHPGMITEARGKLSKTLSEITPGSLNRTFFTNGGTEAVEHAMKLARLYTGRHKIITLYQSYHAACRTTTRACRTSSTWRTRTSTAAHGTAKRRRNARRTRWRTWSAW